jgi:Ohr subfamily peroxiredoxin
MSVTPIQTLYTTTATAKGGREGHVKSADGVVNLDLAMPKEMGGPGGAKANPETLFASGYAACFEGALRLVARMQKKNVPAEATITSSVSIGKTPDGGFGLAVELRGNIPGMPREEAEKLMHDAHQVCPYSRATRGNIDVKLSVE